MVPNFLNMFFDFCGYISSVPVSYVWELETRTYKTV